MKELFKGKSPTVIGLYIGVILGCIVMMVAGGLGYTSIADSALIVGVFAGAGIGSIAGMIADKRSPAKKDEPADPDDGALK